MTLRRRLGVAILAVAAPAASLLAAGCAPAGCVTAVPHVPGYTAGQVRNAAVIACTGGQMGVGRRGQQVAVAAATQESSLRNLAGGDRDSVGLFQQRRWWGSYAERRDPVRASRKFYAALKRVRGWEAMPVGRAAQAVQRSAYPSAYDDDVAGAARILDALDGQARKARTAKARR